MAMSHELPQVQEYSEGEAVAHLPGKEYGLVPAGISPLPRLEVLTKNRIKVLSRPGNSTDLNPIKKFWLQMKLSVAQKEPTSYRDLIKKVTEVWLMETSKEACEKLANNGLSSKEGISHIRICGYLRQEF